MLQQNNDTGTMPFKCTECDYVTTQFWYLVVHMKSVHKCLKAFKCSEPDDDAAAAAGTKDSLNELLNNTIPVKRKRSILNYTEIQMAKAVEAVRNGVPKKAAARQFKVPKGTLLDKLKGRTPMKRRMGRIPYLSEAEENTIAT